MNPRSKQALQWAGIIILAGYVVRYAPVHLPLEVKKYGGSLLWAAMVYALFVAILPKRRPIEVGVIAAVFALAIEVFKLVHTPWLDHFRFTLAGQLLIGRVFSVLDIVAYWAAIALFCWQDSTNQKRLSGKPLQ